MGGCDSSRCVARSFESAKEGSDGHVREFHSIPDRREDKPVVLTLLHLKDGDSSWRQGDTMGDPHRVGASIPLIQVVSETPSSRELAEAGKKRRVMVAIHLHTQSDRI